MRSSPSRYSAPNSSDNTDILVLQEDVIEMLSYTCHMDNVGNSGMESEVAWIRKWVHLRVGGGEGYFSTFAHIYKALVKLCEMARLPSRTFKIIILSLSDFIRVSPTLLWNGKV